MSSKGLSPMLHYNQVMQGLRSDYQTEQVYLEQCREALGQHVDKMLGVFNPRSTGTAPNTFRKKTRKVKQKETINFLKGVRVS